MAKVAVHARFQAESGRGDELVTAIDDMSEAVLDEPDTLVYALHRDRGDPDVVWMYELYADQAALDTHGRSGAPQRLGDRLEDLLVGEPEVGFTHLLRARGLPVER